MTHPSFLSNDRENLHLLEEGQGLPREELDERIAREEFRRPRESLLNICTEFYKHCGPRLKILQNLAGEPRVTSLELLDVKSHMRYSTHCIHISVPVCITASMCCVYKTLFSIPGQVWLRNLYHSALETGYFPRFPIRVCTTSF